MRHGRQTLFGTLLGRWRGLAIDIVTLFLPYRCYGGAPRGARPRVMGAQALSQKRLGVPAFGTSRVRVMHPSACRRSATPRSGWELQVSNPGR